MSQFCDMYANQKISSHLQITIRSLRQRAMLPLPLEIAVISFIIVDVIRPIITSIKYPSQIWSLDRDINYRI